MEEFRKSRHFFVVPIMYVIKDINNHITLGKTTLSEYVKGTFPVIYELEEETRRLTRELNIGYDSSDLEREWYEHKILMQNVLDYLELPPHIIAGGSKYEPTEFVTKTKLEGSGLLVREVYEEKLDDYLFSDYDIKINNFFNPSSFTLEKARLSKEELKQELIDKNLLNKEAKVRIINFFTMQQKN